MEEIDLLDLCDSAKVNHDNIAFKNIEAQLNEIKLQAKDNQQSIFKVLSEKAHFKNEITSLKNSESEKQAIVKNNQILISEIKAHLKVAQEKYVALVNDKDIQFQNISKQISELADINTTLATTLMKQLELKVKLNNIENNIWEVKYLRNNKEITLNYNILKGKFSLESMTPSPVNFNLLQGFLNTTQDISGFIYSANKYFLKLQNQN